MSLWLVAAPLYAATGLEILGLEDYPAEEVIAGLHDEKLKPSFPRERAHATWWRVTSSEPVAPSSKLLIHETYNRRVVESWLPGASEPHQHKLTAEDAKQYSVRALVIDLPDGLEAGQPLWLKVYGKRLGVPTLSIESATDFRLSEMSFVRWRTAAYTLVVISVILALVFWRGTRDRGFLWLGIMLFFTFFYLSFRGGDIRAFSFLKDLYRSQFIEWSLAGASMSSALIFTHEFLRLPKHQPKFAVWFKYLAVVQFLAALLAFFPFSFIRVLLANIILLLSIGSIVAACARGVISGSREAAWVWIMLMPLALLSAAASLYALEWIQMPFYNSTQALVVAAGASALLMTIASGDRLVQMRNDRDSANVLADNDELTGLLRRQAIERYLDEQVAYAEQTQGELSLAFIDVDHFKEINDKYGHQVGDTCLRELSARLKADIRGGDILGRYGGDELILLMPGTEIQAAYNAMERLRQNAAAQPIRHENSDIDISRP